MSEPALKIEEIKIAPLANESLRQYEHEVQTWLVNAAPGTTEENITDPTFWSNIASRFRAPSRLLIMSEDGSWAMDALVVVAERSWAKVCVLSSHDLTKGSPKPAPVEGMEVRWGAPALRYCVYRTSDNARISEKHQTREIAQEWLESHRVTLER